jgi:hypothetical protein
MFRGVGGSLAQQRASPATMAMMYFLAAKREAVEETGK